MSLFETIFERARAAQSTIVLPEGGDPRVTAAAGRVLETGLARIVLLHRGESDPGLGPHDALAIINPETDGRAGRYAETLYELRRHKGLTREQAQEAVKDSLVFSSMMTRLGEADGYVAGAAHTTASVLRAALQVVGVAKGARQVSSFFIMEHRMAHQAVQGVALYADCAMVIDPGPEELADIAMATARHARSLLGIEPVVALLSFSTAGSAVHPCVDKVRQAGELVTAAMPGLTLLPEVQFDAAILPDILAKKAPDLEAAAPANVFIFPDLQSANIGYKIAERIGGVIATGPILQGLSKPVNDLSRGCGIDDIVRLIAITALQGQPRHP